MPNGAGGFDRPTIALCIGGASCVQQDIADALDFCEPDFVVACNDAIAIWPGPLNVAVTLHPEKLAGWRDARSARGYSDATRYLVHGDYVPDWTDLVEFRLPGQGDSGSSGLFMVKAALIDLGADIAILAGVPLDRRPHFFDAEQWQAAVGYRAVWQGLRPEYCARIRSMSGWTAEYFGRPDGAPMKQEATQMAKLDKIAYEPHPVSAERKRELNAQGYKIVDARFAPVGRAEPEIQADDDIATMSKADLLDLLEQHGWDGDKRLGVDKLREIAAAVMFVGL